ncbi:C5a anaphylatoxin chemotactic receptor 1 [Amia ocellicauda]|uniref:C5a anaphylatoxin chemotactic receptor 1 n=1 Tax=Amia ocellicauda TaxID=2972642 RepID=UPI0034642335
MDKYDDDYNGLDYNGPDYNGSDYNITDWFYKTPSGVGKEQLAGILAYSLVFLLGVPGNLLVIWIAGFRMKRSVNTLWFLNLALADLLCCLSLPFLISHLIMDYHWPYGDLGCKLINVLIFLNMFCSVFLLVLISLDRWALVSKPVWCQNWRRPQKARWVCVLVWVLALLFCSPMFSYMKEKRDPVSNKLLCQPNYTHDHFALMLILFRFLFGFLTPFIIIMYCHAVVYRRASTGRVGTGQAKSRKTRQVICAVVLGFFFCWLPYHILGFILLLTPSSSHHMHQIRIADVFALCLAYFNSCLNPVLYVCVGRSFKDSLRKSLKSVLENFMSEDAPNQSICTRTTSRTMSEKPQHSMC